MLILAVETSCDDTAVAVLEDTRIIHQEIHHQKIHEQHGGIVPELASRSHLISLPVLAKEVISKASVKYEDIDVFAATAGPGLIGSLLTGLSWSKAMAFALKKRFLGINHLAAHLFVLYPLPDSESFPSVALLASGGHTGLFFLKNWYDCSLLGATRDDAAGEAFDKCAKLMGLGYPGGAEIDRIAELGDPEILKLPSPLSEPTLAEFSFSGLKTAAKITWEDGVSPENLAASFRKTVVDILLAKTISAAKRLQARSVMLAGGVTANSLLRKKFSEVCLEEGLEIYIPEKELATDNAVMVGRAAAAILSENPDSRSDLTCNAFARWEGNRLEALVRQ